MKSQEKKREKNNLLIFTIVIISVILLALFFILTGKRTNIEEKEFISPSDALREELSNEVKDIIVSLDTPYKVVDYLNNNFLLLGGEDILPFSLERFIQEKKGTETDLAIFTAYVIGQHGPQASVLRYKYISPQEDSQNEKIKSIVPIRISLEDIPKYIYFVNGNSQIVEAGGSFRESIHKEEERLNIKATRYIAYFAGDFNLERGDGIWIDV